MLQVQSIQAFLLSRAVFALCDCDLLLHTMKTRSKEAPLEKEPAERPAVFATEDTVTPVQEDEKSSGVKSSEVKSDGHSKRPKKHKHKKHRKRRDLIIPFQVKTPTKDADRAVPHLKLKIKLGGETFATKSVSRSSVTDAVLTEQESLLQQEEDEEEEDNVMDDDDAFQDEDAISMSDTEIVEEDDEEAWLEALEAGELNEHGELKKEKDVNLLTARQKALLQVKADNQEQLWELPLPTKPSEMMTEEMIMKRAVRAQRRRDQAQKKDLENKKQTIERLLKKQEVKSKILKSGKPKKKTEGAPQIRYINSLTGCSLSYPEGLEFPLLKTTTIPPPSVVTCGADGCNNPKKYSCSKTGVPLCSLECYKRNQMPVLEIAAR